MREKIPFSALKPFALAVVLYATFVIAYFAPQFGGDVLVQGDITQYKGMAQEIIETREATGEDPQWSGSMFGGMPAYLINVDYPAQIIKRIGGTMTSLVDTPAAFIFFAMLSMWLMLVMMGVNGYVAIFGGAAYALSTYFMLIIEAGHVTKMWALVYAPMMMGAIYASLRRGGLGNYALAALFISLELGANHPQITYYFVLAAAALWLSELLFAWREGEIKRLMRRTAFVAVAALVALVSNLSPLWYTAEHTPYTIRGGSEISEESVASKGLDLDYATRWSYGRAESFNMLIPNFMGKDSGESFAVGGEVARALRPYGVEELAQRLPAYWGTQPFTAGATYLGAVIIFLACLGFGLSKGRERWWIVGISIFMLLLAWGSNLMWFTELAFNILPGYNKFRTVSMALVVVQWSVPLLATYGVMHLVRGEGTLRAVAWATGLTAGLTLLFIVAGDALFSYGYRDSVELLINIGFPDDGAHSIAQAMVGERVAAMGADGWRTIIYILLTAGVTALYIKGKLKSWMMVSGVSLLAIVDLTAVDLRFLGYENFTSPRMARIAESAADMAIKEDRGESGEREYRVLNLAVSPFNDATTSYHHRSIGGYHGAKLSRYQDIIDVYFSSINSRREVSPRANAILDMLNTRYIITPEREVTLREGALGAAWFVDVVERVDTPRAEIDRLGIVDLSRVGVVARDEAMSGNATGRGVIEIEEYQPHYQRYRYSADAPATAIFSEIHYPLGWRAYIDGVEAPYFRANYILRGMELPEGEHTIEWRFRAPRWGFIEGLTLVASLAIILTLLTVVILKIYGTKSNPEA